MAGGTEEAAHRYRRLDVWPAGELLTALWEGQTRALAACAPVLPALAAATEAAAARLSTGSGRLIYAGAGSSGMVAALDALDLGPTFDWPADRLVLLIAGGLDLSRGLAGAAEDDEAAGRADLVRTGAGPEDVVVGVSASGASAYTVGVLRAARERGALTLAVGSVAGAPLLEAAEHPILTLTGPEVIAGSTRLGAGTAQKVVLNLFSTGVMTALGSVYDNMMINVRPENAKLRRRCAAMVARIAGVGEPAAVAALERYGDVRRAVLGLGGVESAEIDRILAETGGSLRRAMERAGAAQNRPPSL
ncbi:N-acetylmuramic acid 6-phosphate etherase [Azospirillum picis]|uniref:N-acetylmuramic acid 6-phosphate etherase n=1 Tax=Azospirillum picis TaxID=488438 RepID=A0ABU0MMP6_9PROT|nr:N-acetylmuramic acid 6-phosphate etherase [Azospirillum picis]MBP2300779.1 N-acetylmuramic acid 6-phosphate etherase [Azospirillum picis]MDQ0534748.1 N-acetylmuramic acid 6-phosphate etherase [Azospirillum picis]